MIQYNPADAVQCVAEGDYMATIVTVEEKQSQAGNEMHVIGYMVYAGDRQVQVLDYIPYPKMTWRLKRLAQALGQEDGFKAGKFDPEAFIGSNVTLTLIVEERDGYDPQNRIKAWSQCSTAAPNSSDAPPEADPDLPF